MTQSTNPDSALDKAPDLAITTENLKDMPIEEHHPEYMQETYDWAYVNPRNVKLLDREIIVWILLFLNAGRLKNRYLNMLKKGSSVWQVAHVYGDLVAKAADKVGAEGVFHLSDLTKIQFEHGTEKLKDKPWAHAYLSDASAFDEGVLYDSVCSFFLLHEVPNDKKREVVANMIKKVKDDGQMIFVDYHKPHILHPIGYILRVVNKLLEPYAFALWDHEIAYFGIDENIFNIEKETIFGGVYQILRVTKR
ncbi:methyltransferase [Gammaproteobacteria bacterium]|nr:methyltransferase [Gammaproteobacteria bacterium]